jgi:hypothetical protein
VDLGARMKELEDEVARLTVVQVELRVGSAAT